MGIKSLEHRYNGFLDHFGGVDFVHIVILYDLFSETQFAFRREVNLCHRDRDEQQRQHYGA